MAACQISDLPRAGAPDFRGTRLPRHGMQTPGLDARVAV